MPLCSDKVLCIVTIVFTCTCVIAHLLLGAAAAWGFLLATDAANSNAVDASDRAAFLGLMSVYYSLFGVWLALSELRLQHTRVVGFLLRPFAFLNSYLGRGCFELYVGTTFLVLKWDPQRPEVSRAAGGLEIAVGMLSILLVLGRVIKDPVDAPRPEMSSDAKWLAAASGSSESVPSTPVPLLAASGPGPARFPALLSDRVSGAAAPHLPGASQEASSGVVTQRNPFLGAT